jgi:UDP-glucose 4-epimerase
LSEHTTNDPGGGAGAVIVTGSAGRLGKRLVRQLHRVRAVIGVDRKPFSDRPADVHHHELDVRSKKVREVFKNGVSALVHLGVLHQPRGDFAEHHAWNVIALKTLLEHVIEFRVKKVVLLSSANVYGPRPDNPQFLNEEAPLLGAGPFGEIRDLVELDMVCQSFFWREPAIETVILRPANILGTVKNAPSNYLRLPVVPTLLGFDPMVQAVHQDDVVSALLLALTPGLRGIFNVAGPPPLSLSRALGLLGRRTLPVPHGIARLGIDRLFRLGVSSFPAPELDFIRYVCMVDDSRARSELGYAPAHDIESTLRAVDEERWVGSPG